MSHWPMAKAQLVLAGPWQKQNYFSLANGFFYDHQTANWRPKADSATHKNKTIFHWPMAKTKLIPIGPWLFLAIKQPLAGGSWGGQPAL